MKWVLFTWCIALSLVQSFSTWDKLCKFGNDLGQLNLAAKGSKKLEFEELGPRVRFSRKGLLLCTINQRSGSVLFRKEFPLYEVFSIWKDLKRYFLNISPARIVVLHMEGNSITGLRNTTDLLVSFGSLFVEHLDLYSSWTWAFVYNGKTLFEKVAYFLPNDIVQHDSLSHAIFPLSRLKPSYLTSESQLEFMRWKYCESNGIMGDLCDENKPAYLNYSHLERNENPLLKSVPVIITAGSRTSYLYQSLKSYLRAWGVVKRNFHVILGVNSMKTISLLKLLNINFTYIPPSQYGDEEFSPFFYYKEVYKYAYEHFKSQFTIFLEEDVEVSLDFFSYISQTMYLLKEDSTLYCIAGHSSNGFEHGAHDEYTLIRGSVQVGWGYIVTNNYIKEALEIWPTHNLMRNVIYDGWMYLYVIGTRECIFPEISRTHHFGIGMNTVLSSTEASFFATPLHNATKHIKFQNLERLKLGSWTKDLRIKIKNSIPVSESPCRENFLTSLKPGSYVMFYNFSENNNYTHYNHGFLSSCFRAWMYSFQGQHNFVKFVRVAMDIFFYLVGFPESSFSDLKPQNYSVINIETQPLRDRNEYVRVFNIMQNMLYIKMRNVTKDHILPYLFQ